MGNIRSIANITENAQKFSVLAWPILVDAAKNKSTIDGYRKLAQEIDRLHPDSEVLTGGEHHNVKNWLHCMHTMLEHIDPKIPKIGLIVRTGAGKFGEGLIKSMDDPEKVVQDIYKFPWDTIEYRIFPDVVKNFKGKKAREKEAYRAKQKVEKARLENNPKKAAKKLEQSIKNGALAPSIKKFLVKHKPKLLELIKTGMDISKAYLELLKLYPLDAKATIRGTGDYFVYWGELVDKTNGNSSLCGHIKIGLTNNVEKRAKQLAGGVLAPIEFVVLGKLKCKSLREAFYLESYAHSKNALNRYEGSEFFAYKDKNKFISGLSKILRTEQKK